MLTYGLWMREQKRATILEKKRALSGPSSPPRVIISLCYLLFGLSACVNLNAVEEDILSLLSEEGNTTAFPVVASSEYKLRTTVLKAPQGDLVACMEMAKVADLLAFVASPNSLREADDIYSFIDSFGSQCLSVFKTLGLPSTVVLIRVCYIVGVVTEVGKKVEKCKVGDKVGVGCLVGLCGSCESCKDDLENYCIKIIPTYSAPYYDGSLTYGGYSDIMVASEHFIVRIPGNMPLDDDAPLLCAGITSYSPMRYFGLDEPGQHIGVVGLGGLGRVAIKFAKAFAAKHNITADIEVIAADYVNTSLERLAKAEV
ncbi:hypothetical protein OROMI_018258 [Orobanche minor]